MESLTILILIIVLILWASSTLLLYFGAIFAKITERTIGKSFIIIACSLVLQYLIAVLFVPLDYIFPLFSWFVGGIVSFIAGWWITKRLFNTTWKKAFLAIIFPYILLAAIFVFVLIELTSSIAFQMMRQ